MATILDAHSIYHAFQFDQVSKISHVGRGRRVPLLAHGGQHHGVIDYCLHGDVPCRLDVRSDSCTSLCLVGCLLWLAGTNNDDWKTSGHRNLHIHVVHSYQVSISHIEFSL